jgi:glycine cleavage system H protein
MDGFTYINIFETKGIEYLAIAVFFVILIPFWLILNREVKPKKQLQKSLGILTSNSLKIPQGILFSRFHTWTHLQMTGIAKVGLDDLLLHITGKVNFNSIKYAGENVKKGDLLAEINQQGKILKIYSPISGEIRTINSELAETPELLNEDSYGKGWLYEIKPISWVADTNSYFMAEDATSWATQELERFKDFLATSLGKYSPMQENLLLQDGGELIDQPLSELPNEIWEEFQNDFLSTKVLCKKNNCFRRSETNLNS